MKAIHGGKAAHDAIDAHTIAVLLRGGMRPQASVYPAELRATRALLRRRMHLARKHGELLTHVPNTNSQYNLPAIGYKIADKTNRDGIAERFADPAVQNSIEVDLALIGAYDERLRDVDLPLVNPATHHDAQTLYLLQTVPGIGKILSLVLLYEIHRIDRCPRVQDFASYSAWSSGPRNPPGNAPGPQGPTSAKPISSGPSPKPPSYACGRIRQDKHSSPVWRKNIVREKP
jgi:transposase